MDQLIDWKREYEDLRQEALRAGSHRGHGLALFLSRGMTAWLEALTALRPRPVAKNASQEITRSASRRAARSDDVTGQHGVVVRDKGGT